MKQRATHQMIAAIVTAVVALALGAKAQAQVPCRYDVSYWPNMDCGFGPSPGTPVAVNVYGHVAGRWVSCGDPVKHTFLWTGGPTTTILPIPAGYRSMDPADMNDHGEIVGRLELPTGTANPDRAFLRRANGQVIDLGLPPGANTAWATSINNESEITGSYFGPSLGVRVFVWRDGVFETVLLPTQWGWTPNMIDDFGRLALFPAWSEGTLWSNNLLQPFGLLPDGTWSDPKALSPNGHVVGVANILDDDAPSGDRRRAVFHKDGQLHNLGVLTGYSDSFASGITGTTILGYCQGTTPPGGAIVTFVVINGAMRRLDQFQPNAGLTVHSSPRMARNGIIAAIGRIGPSSVGVILRPISAPTGDLTGDCRVGVPDLLKIINSWGSCGANPFCPSDINGDGNVNHHDLLLIIQNWGQQS